MTGFSYNDVLLNVFFLYIVFYILGSFKHFFVFKTLGVNKFFAFIPLYRDYTLYTAYKGRVWKRNWSVVYIASAVLLIMLAFMIIVTFLGIGLTSFNVPSYHRGDAFALFLLIMVVCVIIWFIAMIFWIICTIVADWPLLTKTWHKVVYIITIIGPIFISPMIASLVSYSDVMYNIISFGMQFLIIAFHVYIGYMIWKNVSSGEYKVVDKYDKKEIGVKQYRINIAMSEHCLIEKIEDNNVNVKLYLDEEHTYI